MLRIFFRDLRDRRISLAIYCVSILGMLVLYFALYGSMKNTMAQLEQMYQTFPDTFFKAMGIEKLSVTAVENFLSIELFSMVWPLMMLFFSISRAGSTLAGEIEKSIMGLYLALPISRSRLFTTKYAGFVAALLLFLAFSFPSIIVLGFLFDDHVNATHVWQTMFLSGMFAWAVYAFALMLSAMSSDRSRVYAVTSGVLVAMYVANIFAGVKESLSWLGKYSVFHYYNAQDVLSRGHLLWTSVTVFAVTAVACTALGLYIFNKRDVAV